MHELIDHTADVGLKVWDNTLKDLFISAGHGITSLIVSGKIQANESQMISVEGEDIEEVFHNWLNELNYLFLVHHKIFCEFVILEISSLKLKVLAKGETYSSKHILQTEIKAVTYHQFYVKEENKQWIAQVFFDL